MKTFTITIDDRMERTLDTLKTDFGKTSKADVFRMGIAILNIANDAIKQGKKLTIADEEDKVVKEIVIPR